MADRFNNHGVVRRSFVAAGLAVLVVGTSSCARSPGGEEIATDEVPTISADVAEVARQDLTNWLVVRGTVAALPNQDVRIAALVPGRIDSLTVAEGDAVRAGQTIARIDPRPIEDQKRQAAAAVAHARTALESARSNLQRTERLFQRGVAAGKEVEDARTEQAAAEAALEQASAELDTIELQLSRTSVTSPITGQVVKRLMNVGEQVDGTAAQPIVEVANLDAVEVGAQVPADRLGVVHVGQQATVATETYPDRTMTGEIIAMAPAVDPVTNSVLARVRVANPGHALKVGMFAEVRVALESRRGVLVVPPSAVSRGEEGPAVYVVSKDMAERTAVTLGLETPEGVEIQSGLKEGQQVLTSAIHGLGERARLASEK